MVESKCVVQNLTHTKSLSYISVFTKPTLESHEFSCLTIYSNFNHKPEQKHNLNELVFGNAILQNRN